MDARVTRGNSSAEDARKTAILDAAAKLIAERGYHDVRVADIARAVGTSTGTVHYYFPTKEDVLRNALQRGVYREFERHSGELKKIDSSYERLLRLLELQLPKLGPIREELTIWLQYWAECSIRPDLRPTHNAVYMRWHQTIVHLVQRGQARGEFRKDVDPEPFTAELTALVDGFCVHILTGIPTATITTMRESLVAYVQRNLVVAAAN